MIGFLIGNSVVGGLGGVASTKSTSWLFSMALTSDLKGLSSLGEEGEGGLLVGRATEAAKDSKLSNRPGDLGGYGGLDFIFVGVF